MGRILVFSGALLLALTLCVPAFPASTEFGCRFLRESPERLSDVSIPSNLRRTRVANFEIHSSVDLTAAQRSIVERSAHFLETELGWKFPATRTDMNEPALDVYMVPAPMEFEGTVRPGPIVILNERLLKSPEFAATWIHFLAHAAELQYRPAGEYWFYEAVAGWMEGQFQRYGSMTRLAQQYRGFRPQIPLNDDSPMPARGASRFVELLARPFRDVVRQVFERWSFSGDEPVMQIIDRVLAVNHLPGLPSYLMNYYLQIPWGSEIRDNTKDIVLQPYSAIVQEGRPEGGGSGGIHLSFVPEASATYSASLVYYTAGEKGGTIVLKQGLQETLSLAVPFVGMDHFRVLILNGTSKPLRGKLQKTFDSSIPAVLEYFRANSGGQGGVQLEWKTLREDGVAFWNLYRLTNGNRERLNQFPIPASVNSDSGVHYMFVDSADGAFYSLEAITGEGLPSSLGTVELAQ